MTSKGITHREMLGTVDDIVTVIVRSDQLMKKRHTGERSGGLAGGGLSGAPVFVHPSGFWIAEMGGKVDRT